MFKMNSMQFNNFKRIKNKLNVNQISKCFKVNSRQFGLIEINCKSNKTKSFKFITRQFHLIKTNS